MWQRGPDGEIVRVEPRASDAEERTPGAEEGRPPRARLALALRLGFRDTYDYLGSLVLQGALVTFLASGAAGGGYGIASRLTGALPGWLPFLLGLFTAAAGLVLIGAPLTAGLFRFARRAAAREEPELFDLAWGFRHALGRSLALGGVQVFGTLLLAGNCLFYLAQRHLLLMALGASLSYLLLFWLGMLLYQWPILLEQGTGALAAVRKSALLVLDNAPFTFGLLLAAAVLTAVLGVTVVGVVLILPGALAMLTTQATRELLRKYGLLPPDPTLDPLAGETHEVRGLGWHE